MLNVFISTRVAGIFLNDKRLFFPGTTNALHVVRPTSFSYSEIVNWI